MTVGIRVPGQQKEYASLLASSRKDHRACRHGNSWLIKHGMSLIARGGTGSKGARGMGRLRLVFGLMAGVGLTLAGGIEARAQIELKDLNNLPDQGSLPPSLKYIPTDPRLAIRTYFQTALPPLWWGRDVDFGPGRVTVEIHPPVGWQGNPSGAMIRFCPGPNHNLWRLYSQIELRPFFQKKSWPSHICRRL